MKIKHCIFEFTNETDFQKALYSYIDGYENVTMYPEFGVYPPRAYFDIGCGNATSRIMLQFSSSYLNLHACTPSQSSGQYYARFQLQKLSYGQVTSPTWRNLYYVKIIEDDLGNFCGFTVPYSDSRNYPHFWLLSENDNGEPVLVNSATRAAYRMGDTPTSIGNIPAAMLSRDHESNETVYIEQIIVDAGTGCALPALWFVDNNSFYDFNNKCANFLYVGTEDGYYLKLYDILWIQVSFVEQDVHIVVEAS